MRELRHLINITDLSVEELDHLMETADDIIEHPEKYQDACAHKKLATLFFEPSTRTRLSFTAAMMELGGNVLGFDQAQSSSSAKGETVADTIIMAGCYADIIAMRHPKEGAPVVGAVKSSVPIINAGDGGHFHPTQTLTDLMTIHRKKGEIGNFTVGLCGDLKYGRTVHSLIEALLRYEGVKYVMIAPEELRLPGYIREKLDEAGVEWSEVSSLDDAIPELDILYMTRIQQERFPSWEEYEKLKDSFILTKAMLKPAKEDMIVLHPLPRVNEISVDVDDDPRACYFYQALMGKYIRMALILYLLGIK
ncbi:MAG: aspartate carbamoyltransferase [Mogibacterium sp.]|nr:aspartate carbamoyltransferase [Mogibacterium sp.]